MKIKWIYVLSAILVVGFLVYQGKQLRDARADYLLLQLKNKGNILLADSTVAQLAALRADKDSLATALKTAQELNGTLLAAANIKITPKKVGPRYTTTGTVVTNQIRTLTITDTTTAGILFANIVAPPPPAGLLFSYDFTPASINATVSLVSINDTTVVFAVKYVGGETQIRSSFAKIPPKQRWFSSYVEGAYSILGDNNVVLRTGLTIKAPFVSKLSLVAEASYLFREKISFAGLGTRYTF
jgi:hypothetical protein